jgi:SAM-dependent methyltransferase
MAREERNHAKYVSFLSKKKSAVSCDFGCGNSGELATLSKNSGLTVGFDADLNELKKARRLNLKNVELIRGDCLRPPFQEGKFDVLVSTHLLEHLMRPEQGIDNIHRLLKHKGYCFIKVPCMVEVFATTFGNPLLQIGRALIHRSLDAIYYEGKTSLVGHLLLAKKNGSWRLRRFMPKIYQAKTINEKVGLDEYIDNWLKGVPTGLAHKHWFTTKDWIRLFKASKLKLVAYQGFFCYYILAAHA